MTKRESIKTHCGGTWTRSRYYSFIRSALRRAFTRYPVNYQARNAARRAYKGDNPRQKYEYQCAICKGWFPQKETAVDHITPAGSLQRYEDLPGFVERLFCEKEGLQIACKACHGEKTKAERLARKLSGNSD